MKFLKGVGTVFGKHLPNPLETGKPKVYE